jgi:hypothetical protein
MSQVKSEERMMIGRFLSFRTYSCVCLVFPHSKNQQKEKKKRKKNRILSVWKESRIPTPPFSGGEILYY